MFSKDDYIKYFNQVSEIEKKMLVNIDELLNLLKKESSIEKLKKIRKDEIKHINILKKISKIVNDIDT